MYYLYICMSIWCVHLYMCVCVSMLIQLALRPIPLSWVIQVTAGLLPLSLLFAVVCKLCCHACFSCYFFPKCIELAAKKENASSKGFICICIFLFSCLCKYVDTCAFVHACIQDADRQRCIISVVCLFVCFSCIRSWRTLGQTFLRRLKIWNTTSSAKQTAVACWNTSSHK